MKKERKPFEEALYTDLYQCFSSVGITPSIPQLEALRTATTKLAKLLETESKLTAIRLVERMQNKISEAFEELQKTIIKVNVDKSKKNTDN